jgi:transcriptional regulator with XRE-family HTH domain
MAQSPSTLTPHASPRHFLGAELRSWRQRRGLSLVALGRAVYTGPDLLRKVEKAARVPSAELIRRCDEELDAGGALVRLHCFVDHLGATMRKPATAPSESPSTILVKIVAEVVPDGPASKNNSDRPAEAIGGARIYALEPARPR